MWFWRWREWLVLMLAVFLTTTLFAGIKGTYAFKLSGLDGEHTYYTYSASSQAKMQSNITFLDALHVRGESVELSLTSDVCLEQVAKKILEKYAAEVVCVEVVDDTTSYYAYTPNLGEGVWVNGKKVNLHIAVKRAGCVVGTPIIFGGF